MKWALPGLFFLSILSCFFVSLHDVKFFFVYSILSKFFILGLEHINRGFDAITGKETPHPVINLLYCEGKSNVDVA